MKNGMSDVRGAAKSEREFARYWEKRQLQRLQQTCLVLILKWQN